MVEIEVPEGGPAPGSPGRQERQSSAESDERYDNERFADVLSSVRLDRAPRFCANIHRQRENVSAVDASTIAEPVISEQPKFGESRVFFTVSFDGGPKWMLGLPIWGAPDDVTKGNSNSLKSDVLIMKLIRRSTTIPIPEVIAFDPSLENDLKCPFILTEFVDGLSLSDTWYDHSCPLEQLYQRRSQTLGDIAAAMAQLERFSFDTGGSLIFDDAGNIAGVGPTALENPQVEVDEVMDVETDAALRSAIAGPWPSVSAFYSRFLDHWEEPPAPFHRGQQRLLRKVLQWVPEPKDSRSQFVLSPPSSYSKNFIVSPDGHLRGVINWAGVQAVPRSIGYESYPLWLCRDVVIGLYGGAEDMDHVAKPYEDTPSALLRHRAEYEEFMRSALASKEQGGPSSVGALTATKQGKPTVSRTKNSLYMLNLLMGASSCFFRGGILQMLVHLSVLELFDGNVPDEHRFLFLDSIKMLDVGELDAERDGILKKGIQKIFKDGVSPVNFAKARDDE